MKKLIVTALTASALFLSGCITIFEKYSFNKDGSGSMEYLIDMKEMYDMINAFADEEQKNEMNLNETFGETIPELSAIPGISNVQLTGTPEEYVFGIKYDFKDVAALNAALGVLLEKEQGKSDKYVDFNKKVFTRYYKTSDEFSKEALMGEEGGEGMDESMVDEMLQGMKYKIYVNMPGKVKSVKTEAGYTMEGDKAVLIEANLLQLSENDQILKTVITSK